MRVAVIGTGISGNVAAYYLNKQHDVTVYEANGYIGGHTHTHDIEWAGSQYAIDTGFIVFNEKTYPNFIALMDELGVASKPTTMSFSVKSELNGLEYNGHSLNTLFAQRLNLLRPSFHRMIRDILRFNREAPLSLEQNKAEIGLGEYLRSAGYSKQFIDHYIIPMGAAIWSTDPRQMQEFPARFFIRFFLNHGLLQVKDRPRWFVIEGGSKEYVTPLTNSFAHRIRLGTPVESVMRFPSHVVIKARGHQSENFDAVFIATHSNQALKILADASKDELDVLGAIKYQQNEAVLHTDKSLLPRRRRAWAAWNYHIPDQQQEQVALTYNMNILQGIDAPVQFCVTLNNSRAVSGKKIIKRVSYEHPVYTPDVLVAQARQHEINATNRTYFCGAYWRNGFHEDGVVSALNALQHFKEKQNEELYIRRAS
jgi:predicted NAD/FAD-binding protein